MVLSQIQSKIHIGTSGWNYDHWKEVFYKKLGVILFQLPPTLTFEREVFEAFCSLIPKNKCVAIKARHPSWMEQKALWSLKNHNIAWCISDTAGRYPYLEAVTSNFIYIRLHGSKKLYVSEYAENEISNWAEKIKKWDIDTYVYFDNDAMGHAPKNALKLKDLLTPETPR